ncbi:MAG: oxidoreductase [Desulfobulbaceae bacterium BRH_c16a]|nr:MAG: oxidoreductase [Desulfobulbaceae bacterium BRH_c16a]
MKKYCFVIDVAKCENCNNCFLSCKDEHCGNDWPGYSQAQPLHGHRWMNILTRERGAFPFVDVAYLPKPCGHCDDAPCLRAAADGAVHKRADGIVLIDPVKAKGRKTLVGACPYGVIWWNETLQLPQKCTFCAHLLDGGWHQPRCVQSCPTGALSILHATDEELAGIVQAEGLEVLDSGSTATRPRCYYKNLYRFTGDCIVGSVAATVGDITECVIGANVSLHEGSKSLGERVTDEFGDFKFDRLPTGVADYELTIAHGDRQATRLKVSKKESLSLGTIWIEEL